MRIAFGAPLRPCSTIGYTYAMHDVLLARVGIRPRSVNIHGIEFLLFFSFLRARGRALFVRGEWWYVDWGFCRLLCIFVFPCNVSCFGNYTFFSIWFWTFTHCVVVGLVHYWLWHECNCILCVWEVRLCLVSILGAVVCGRRRNNRGNLIDSIVLHVKDQ